MSRTQGFSLIEVLLVSILVGVLLVATTSAMSAASSAKLVLASGPLDAARLARDVHSIALGLPSGAPTTERAAGYHDLAVRQDLDGAVFSPPIDATGAEVAALAAWTQRVAFERLALSDLQTPSDAPLVAAGAWPALDRLTVTIVEGEVELGRFVFWMTP